MRLLSLIAALLMFLLPVQASAQDPIAGASVGTPVATLPGAIWADFNNDGYVDGYVYNGAYHAGAPAAQVTTAPAVSGLSTSTPVSGADPRWGVLAELAERDLAFNGVAATVRWTVPNESLLITGWYPFQRQALEFMLDRTTGIIRLCYPTMGGECAVNTFSAAADGRILLKGSKDFVWKTGDGSVKIDGFGTLRPITDPKMTAAIGKQIAAGRTRAADPTLNRGAPQGAAALQTAVAGPRLGAPVEALPSAVWADANNDGVVDGYNHNGVYFPGQPRLAPFQAAISASQPVATTVQNPQPASSMSPAIAAAAASSGPRYALIIGNSQYQASLGRLPNPVNDAQSVAAALRAVGFDVDLVLDADQKGMKRAISRFGERLSTARGATGLFYYAGHGIQSRGTNYLIPVSAPIEREADLDLEAVAADTVLAQMEDAGAATSIVILDACRNMPLARSFRSSSRGLARMDAPNGSFIAYSTAPGSTAADGDGRNSPFASALVKQIGQKGLPIEVMFRGIRKDVLQATAGQQTPWDSSSLVDPFYFVP